MRVIVVGVGEIGFELARNLERRENTEVVLIDIDGNRCDELAAELDALVIHGEGSDPEILKKAQIEEANALVATTDSDAINTVIAMLGHRFGVEKVIVKLKGVGLRSACHEIGVNKIIAPEFSAASEIVSTLFGFDLVNFSVVASGGLQLYEVAVASPSIKKLSELDLPDGVHIVAVMRGNQMLLPRPDTKMENEDQLVFLIEQEISLERVRKQVAPKND